MSPRPEPARRTGGAPRGRRTAGVALVLLALALSGCGRGPERALRPARGGPASGVFVASEGSDSILALDPQTLRARRVIQLSPTGPGARMPHQMAITPDHETLLITEYGYGALAFYNLRTNTLEAEVPVGGGPHGIALSRNGRFAYVAASQSKWVAVVDVAGRRRVAEIPTQMLPWQIVIAADDRQAWVTSQGVDTIALLDLRRRAPVRLIDLGEPYALAASALPDGRLVAGGHSSNRLFVLDRAGDVLARPGLGGPAPTLRGPENASVYFCQIVPTGGAMPVAFAPRPGAAELVAANHGTNELTVLGLPDLGVKARIPVGPDPQDVAVSPDGGFAFVTAGASGELWKVDLRGSEPAARVRVGARPVGVFVMEPIDA